MMKKEYIVIGLALIQILSFSVFLKGFFPLKQGLKGFARLEDSPAVPGHTDNSVPRGHYDRLIIVVIDALRADFVLASQTYMPFLKEMIRDGHVLPFTAKAHPPTVTLPRIKALTTGGIPGFVDVVLNFGSSSLEEDNIISQLKRAGKELVFFGDDTWMKLFPDHFSRTDGTTSFFVTDYTEVDMNVTRHLPEEMTLDDWDVMVLHYLGLDHIGHLDGPRSPLISPKLFEMDNVLQKLYQAMRQWLDERDLTSLMMVCGDHGMSDQGGHGGASPGETTVPVIFFSPSLHDTVPVPALNMASPGSIMQIDVAPTLAALMGIPIPKNNLGEIVASTLVGYSLEDKVRLMQVNGHQVSLLLEQNVANVEKENGYRRYEQVMNRHSDWLKTKSTNMSRESWEMIGNRLVKDYGKAVQEMRSRVSETSTNYDLHGMGVGIVLICLILLLLLLLSVSDMSTFRLSTNRIAVCLICCIPVVLGHMTMCTSQLRSDFLCMTHILILPIQLMVMIAVVMATLFLVMSLVKYRGRIMYVRMSCVEWVFIGGSLLHTLSLLSSSFVEEEHQTWYFYITTLHAVIICNLIGAVCSQAASQRAGSIGDFDRHEQTTDNQNSHKTRRDTSYHEIIKQREKLDCGSSSITVWTSVTSVAAMFVVLMLCSVLRRWNQTGDKWLTVPDMGDWLVRPENKSALSAVVAISMLCLVTTRWRSSSLIQSSCSILAAISTYCSKAATGVIVFPGVYSGMTKGVLEAQLTYLILFLSLIMLLWQWRSQQGEPGYQATDLWSSLQTIWLLVMMLLLRPHNSALVAMVAAIESLVSGHMISITKLRPAFLTLYCLWMGQATFFFQGNSNSLTTVDVAAGYVGLHDYHPLLIGLLMCLSTYAGPIFWMVSLLKYISTMDVNLDDVSRTNKLRVGHQEAAVTVLMSRALPLSVYCVLVTVERYHLFVWTVFSPKLLYEGVTTVVLSTFAILHAVLALSHSSRAKSRKIHER
ncbi:GPI ethanolamine phosphate transferase 2-like [Haliotis cracherodii]|uniref:GPI ethanolamine phosphate transferase 2-like n=1 Tax=Haliotis cracherodii TaxID=6455 RepID=UPI0039E9569E